MLSFKEHMTLEQKVDISLCPENHEIEFRRENYGQDFSANDRDILTGQPMYEIGLICDDCGKTYGFSKLKSSP